MVYAGHDKEIAEILECIDSELWEFRKKVENPSEKTTDQFVGDIVGNLERRERFLKTHLRKILTQNEQYHMPEEWIVRVLKQIEYLVSDGTTKAKVDMVAGQQAAFWNVLKDIQEVLTKPEQIDLKMNRMAPSEEDP